MNKMQLNRIEESLQNLAKIKLTEFKQQHERKQEPDTLNWSLESAGRQEEFLKTAMSLSVEYHRKNIIAYMPSYLLEKRLWAEQDKALALQENTYKDMLLMEISDIMNRLYLGEGEGLQAIEEFKKFNPEPCPAK